MTIAEAQDHWETGADEAMRIGLLCPPWFPVPPEHYGGIEAVVSLLTEGLVEQGHDVTLFAAGESASAARLVAVHEDAPSAQVGETLPELRHVLSCLRRAGQFDVISDHSGPMAVALSAAVSTPFVHTVHGPLDDTFAPSYDDALAFAPDAWMISLSLEQRTPRPDYPWIANVPNAVDLKRYSARESARGTHLLWIGRMCADKGPDRAIEVAREARLPIVLAGKLREPAECAYFEQHVEPRLGRGARYVGEADHATLEELLHDAIALVNPIEWPEPFGLVMIEALACGVPVLATRRGAAPEIIVDGVTGCLVDDYREMAAAVPAVAAIPPETCRAEAERRFSQRLMVDRYASAFAAAAERREPRRDAPAAPVGTIPAGT
jgi:glycosyltransferase involved in cell wall biosynthesis